MAASVGQHSFIQVIGATTVATSPAVTTATVGSAFVVAVSCSNTTGLQLATDSKSNIYAQIQSTTNDVANTYQAAWWFIVNGAGGSGHTASGNSSDGKHIAVYFVELLGCLPSAAKDQDVAGFADNSSPFTTNTTGSTTQADEIALAFYATGTTIAGPEVLTWGNGFTQIDAGSNTSEATGGIAYKVLSATGTVQGSLTSAGGGTGDTIGFVATFKAALQLDTISLKTLGPGIYQRPMGGLF